MQNSANKKIVFLFILSAVVLGLYWQVKDFSFISFDDYLYVRDNQFVNTGLNVENFKWAFGFNPKANTYWHPLAWLSHMLDVELFGMDAGLHHVTNIILHNINTLLLFFLFLSLGNNLWISVFIALVFAAHPINVESVAWLAERKNVLSTIFWFLSIFAYLFYVKRPGLWRYLLFLACFMLGLFAKPMLVTLPIILLLLDFWPLNRFGLLAQPSQKAQGKIIAIPKIGVPKLILEKLPLLIFSFLSIYLTIMSQPKLQDITSSIPLSLRVENALVTYVKYILNFFWPLNLTIYYPFPGTVPFWQVAGSAICLLAITLYCIRHWCGRPYLLVGWFWFCITLSPVSGIIQSGLWPSMADRWAYLPIIGLLIMIGFSIDALRAKLEFNEKSLNLTGAIIVAILMTLTWLQIGYWENTSTLFSRTLEVDSGNWLAHSHLGVAMFEQNKVPEAIEHYQRSLNSMPDNKTVYYNLARALESQGDYHEAIRSYENAIALDQQYIYAHINLANTLMKTGNSSEALKRYNIALAIEPDNHGLLHNIGILYEKQGRISDAVQFFQQSIRSDPTYAEAYYSLGIAYEKQGKTNDAHMYYLEAQRLQPQNINFNLGLAKIYSRLLRFKDAEYFYNEVLRLSPSSVDALNGLGILHAKANNYKEAEILFVKALEIDPQNIQVLNNLERLQKQIPHSSD